MALLSGRCLCHSESRIKSGRGRWWLYLDAADAYTVRVDFQMYEFFM